MPFDRPYYTMYYTPDSADSADIWEASAPKLQPDYRQ
jgi:hypothetical protein